ncbi:hypothetical protein [Streptomyces parvus]|uniref:hypothetical protein n=1 Tax=Streptomyces parvus TaxID=66428 RepID=UPI0033CAAAF0
MATTAQDVIGTKLERNVAALDDNQDGYLDVTAFERLADRYIQAYGLDKNDRRARALHGSCQVYFMELLRHSDAQEDRLTKDQFVAASRLASVDGSRGNLADGAGHVFFGRV